MLILNAIVIDEKNVTTKYVAVYEVNTDEVLSFKNGAFFL